MHIHRTPQRYQFRGRDSLLMMFAKQVLVQGPYRIASCESDGSIKWHLAHLEPDPKGSIGAYKHNCVACLDFASLAFYNSH
jgi:hypothetical protein